MPSTTEALRSERERYRQEIRGLQQKIKALNAQIILEDALFKVGDLVMDRCGKKYQITNILLSEGETVDSFRYWGYRLKKDGSLGSQKWEIFNTPLHAISNGTVLS